MKSLAVFGLVTFLVGSSSVARAQDWVGDVLAGDVQWTDENFSFLRASSASGSILIQVKINESPVPLTFVLDTGASNIVIKRSAVAKLKLPLKPLPRDFASKEGNMVRKKLAGTVHLETIEFGDLQWEADAVVMEDDSLSEVLAREKIDGILGMNVLRNYTIRIAPKKRKILLMEKGQSSKAVRDYLGFDKAIEVPLKPGLANMFDVDVVLEGKHKFSLLLDTGAHSTVITRRALTEQNVSQSSRVPAKTTLGMTGTAQLYHGEGLLRLDHRRSPTWIEWFVSDRHEGVNGLFGMDILSQYDALIDFPNRRMFLAIPERGVSNFAPHLPATPGDDHER